MNAWEVECRPNMVGGENWCVIRFYATSSRLEVISTYFKYEGEAWAVANKLNSGFFPRDMGYSAFLEEI